MRMSKKDSVKLEEGFENSRKPVPHLLFSVQLHAIRYKVDFEHFEAREERVLSVGMIRQLAKMLDQFHDETILEFDVYSGEAKFVPESILWVTMPRCCVCHDELSIREFRDHHWHCHNETCKNSWDTVPEEEKTRLKADQQRAFGILL